MSVTPADLTGTERAVLLVLMAESRPVPNPDLIALGPELEKAGRDKAQRPRPDRIRPHRWPFRSRAHRPRLAGVPRPPRRGPAEGRHRARQNSWRRSCMASSASLQRADLSLADVFWPDTPSSPADRIRDAYTALAARPARVWSR